MHCFLVFDTVLDGSEAAKHEDFLTLYLPFGLFLLSLFLLYLAFWLSGFSACFVSMPLRVLFFVLLLLFFIACLSL